MIIISNIHTEKCKIKNKWYKLFVLYAQKEHQWIDRKLSILKKYSDIYSDIRDIIELVKEWENEIAW